MVKFCKYCKKDFSKEKHSIYANHVRWCPENKTNGDKGAKKLSEKALERYAKIYKIITYNVICDNCGNNFTLNERESRFKERKGKYFCCYKCSRSRTKETKEKISISSKELWKNEEYANKIIINNTNRNKRFSSKGEQEIKNYLQINFETDNWTSGGGFKYDNVYLTRDMYSNALKTIVEYDGIWHFKDIYGQLKDKQLKDKKLEEWVIQNDWRLIRIKDDFYRKNKEYWLKEIINCIYNKKEQIIKLY